MIHFLRLIINNKMRKITLRSRETDYDVLIDDEDFDRVSKHTWHILHCKPNKYCNSTIRNKGKKSNILLHRLIMGLDSSDKRMINHIDGNGLNNQKSNLEICDKCYNSQSIKCANKNFGCIYIRKDGCPKKYLAQVFINKKRYQKLFYTREEAQLYLDEMKEFAINETKSF